MAGNTARIAGIVNRFQQAFAPCPRYDAQRILILQQLATILLERYEQEGNLADITKAITYHRRVLDLYPPGHPGRPMSLSNLASTLYTRYRQEENVNDLVRVIELSQQALNLNPPGHPLRSYILNDLGSTLDARFQREGDVNHLTSAIKLYLQALDLRPLGHPNRLMSLGNLAAAFTTRYEEEGDVNDLARAIDLFQQALDLTPPGHKLRSYALDGLASALNARYQRGGDVNDFARVIGLFRQALDLRPPGHPLRSQSLALIAVVRFIHYKSTKGADPPIIDSDHPDLGFGASQHLGHAKETSADFHFSNSSIIAFIREASQDKSCSPMGSLRAALQWVVISREIDPDSTLEAYTSALRQLDVVLALGRSLNQRHYRLQSDDVSAKAKVLGVEAATWALRRGHPECAVELLEQGRSLLLTQLGRYRVEHDDIVRADPDLANRFAELSQRLDTSILTDQKIEEVGLGNIDEYERYRKVSTAWYQTIEEIRALPGLGTFLKPTPYAQPRMAAAEGPIIIVIPNKSASDALIISEHSPILHLHLPLATSGRLDELSLNFAEILNPLNDDASRRKNACLTNLRSLWNEVVGPIAQALRDDLRIPLRSRVWWCLTSATCFLPLHAAGLYAKGQSDANFVNLFVSSYTPTIQALVRARRHANGSAPKKLLVVCQPKTPHEAPLGCAMEEADTIAEVVPSDVEVTRLVGKAGTCEAVRDEMESHPWIHFICHGVQAAGQPLDSYLSLHDGHLTLHKIIERNLPNADFAFLAACHSAAGDHGLANEALHLSAAMQFAGFRGVVGTLWTMADEDGPPLAEAFYRKMMKRGDSRGAAVALSNAINQLRRDGVPINRWMRFIHIGI